MSILAMLVNLSLSIICLKAPALIEKVGLTKKGAMTLAFTNMLTWVPLVVVFVLSQFGIAPLWVAVLWLVNIMPGMLLSFQKDNWLSNIVPGKTMGRYLGQRLAVKSLFYLAAFFSFGFLMDYMGENNLVSFGIVFLFAVIMTFVYFYIYTHMHDPKKEESKPAPELPKIKFGLFDFLGDLKQKKLDHFVLFTSLINISIGLSAPFYAVYMLQEQKFSYLSFTIIISVEFLARVISGPFWGRFADKEGNIKVLKIVSRIILALPICWLFSSNIAYLAIVQIISGICWGAFDLSTQSYLYKVAPPQKKLRYIVYTRSLMLFSVAIGGLAGSFIVKDIFEIFGSKLLTVFMISGFLRAVIVMFIMPKLIDLAVNYGIPQQTPFDLKLVNKPAASKHGMFYQPQKPAAVTVENYEHFHKRNPAMEQRLMEAHAAKRELTLLTEAVKNGRPRNWALEAAMAAQTDRAEEKHTLEDIKPVRRPWFGDAEILAGYKERVPAAVGASISNMSIEMPVSRGGLFYNDTGWARYKEESIQAVLKEKKEQKAAAMPKTIFIESSYPWRNSY